MSGRGERAGLRVVPASVATTSGTVAITFEALRISAQRVPRFTCHGTFRARDCSARFREEGRPERFSRGWHVGGSLLEVQGVLQQVDG